MGSGPAVKLAAHYGDKIPALILISPFTTLKNAVKSLFGSITSYLVRERFENIDTIQNVKCPTLIIHG
jgi:pimeloyl-ACP methyl ester carboxylesterase